MVVIAGPETGGQTDLLQVADAPSVLGLLLQPPQFFRREIQSVAEFFLCAGQILRRRGKPRPQHRGFRRLRPPPGAFFGLLPKQARFIPEPGKFSRIGGGGDDRAGPVGFKFLELPPQILVLAGGGLSRDQLAFLAAKTGPKNSVQRHTQNQKRAQEGFHEVIMGVSSADRAGRPGRGSCAGKRAAPDPSCVLGATVNA